MSEERGPDSGPSSRPLWFYAPGGIPLPSTSRKIPDGVTLWTREGDSEWHPISTLPGADRVKEPAKPGAKKESSSQGRFPGKEP